MFLLLIQLQNDLSVIAISRRLLQHPCPTIWTACCEPSRVQVGQISFIFRQSHKSLFLLLNLIAWQYSDVRETACSASTAAVIHVALPVSHVPGPGYRDQGYIKLKVHVIRGVVILICSYVIEHEFETRYYTIQGRVRFHCCFTASVDSHFIIYPARCNCKTSHFTSFYLLSCFS